MLQVEGQVGSDGSGAALANDEVTAVDCFATGNRSGV